MDKFDVAVGLAVLVFVSLMLHGFWSVVYNGAVCGVLLGYALLGVVAGGALLLGRWYKQLETVGIGLALLYLLAMWISFLSPGTLQYC
ncbi:MULTISPECIES: hypothetical protein [Pyrobaculum]|uniref:Uncharacterized protein n=2 Tax=Pyrobaculum arsenaticum TaxID=121277 RepID=A4WHC6_PYRAR|nr:hypothetical protein [Pyrobaculum arsenaticum]ABP49793.1 conserved hypothetical protein [Pyrobaculum arsenaticum DSM 13514]MCY0890772.1 hypothetical protein [Pyrobaculum arsenaticum]NYR15779.1 hypothetical protein [Pyrobaculum arsenaticum]